MDAEIQFKDATSLVEPELSIEYETDYHNLPKSEYYASLASKFNIQYLKRYYKAVILVLFLIIIIIVAASVTHSNSAVVQHLSSINTNLNQHEEKLNNIQSNLNKNLNVHEKKLNYTLYNLENVSIDHKNDVILTNFSRVLLVSNNRGLWSMDIETKNLSILKEAKANKSIDIFDTYLNDTLFWVDEDASQIKSTSEKYPAISYPAKWKLSILRVDFITGKFYLIDNAADTVNVIDMQGKYYGIAVSDINKPCGLELDPAKGYMFIALKSNSILRTDMSGDSAITIVKQVGITAITIDRRTELLYLAIDFVSIESFSYDGTKRATILEIPTKIESIAITNRALFWISKLELCTCEIHNAICKNSSINRIDFKNARTIKSVAQYLDAVQINNPCRKDNGGCQQLCLLIPDTNKLSPAHTCECQVGWELNIDGKTCKHVFEFVLYTQGNFIRGRILNATKKSFVDAIMPVGFRVESLTTKKTIDFDYNMYKDVLYFSDDYNIYSTNVKSQEVQKTIRHSTGNEIAEIAIDWITDTLYFIRGFGSRYSLVALRVSNNEVGYEMVIYSSNNAPRYFGYSNDDRTSTRCMHSLAIDLRQKHILLVDVALKYSRFTGLNHTNTLYKINLNGENKTDIIELNIDEFKDSDCSKSSVDIDLEDSSLYWIHSSSKFSQVSKIDYSGSNKINGTFSNVIDINTIEYPKSIYVHEQWLYLYNTSSIWRVDKSTGQSADLMIPRFKSTKTLSRMMVVSQKIQKIDNDDACAFNNGDCSEFCFASPSKDYVCASGNQFKIEI